MRAPKEIGPDFGFDENDHFRVDGTNRPPGPEIPVDRIVNLDDVRWQFALQFGHARRSCGRHDDLEIGQPRFQSGDQLRADVDFANAYCMQPKHVAIR